ncbi:MAG: hypothetical protein HKN73_17860 [Gemmatimonadetes bacterium]|nr:hypothetical protein [Gemmatimonadota bacterium]
MYGEIPLLSREYTLPDGKTYEWYEPDPDYRPVLPEGAVRGDPSRQVYCSALHIPKYFYVDEERECVECGESFAFTGKEQQFWYEQLGFNLNSVAIRCPGCRALRRRASRYGRQIGMARKASAERPDDPTPYLELAEGLVRQFQNGSTGNLDEAIWAARQARKLWPGTPEPDFWEGLSHWMSDRRPEGRKCLSRFRSHPALVRRRYRGMSDEARGLLESED